MSDYFVCPVCGADVPVKALACPECGSDDETGWSEDTLYDGIDAEIPELDNAYPEHRPGIFLSRPFIIIVSLISLIIFILLLMG